MTTILELVIGFGLAHLVRWLLFDNDNPHTETFHAMRDEKARPDDRPQ